MNCPRCKSDEVCRRRRKSLWDNFKAALGFWPYKCEHCGLYFSAARRYPPEPHVSQAPPAQPAAHSGPEMAFRNDPIRPVAKVVIQADDQVQLDQILMALHRAVSYYQQPSRERATAGSRG
jgi:transposase-like protein